MPRGRNSISLWAELRTELPPSTMTIATVSLSLTRTPSLSVHLCLSVCHCHCHCFRLVAPSVPSKLCLNLSVSTRDSVSVCLSDMIKSPELCLSVCHCHGPTSLPLTLWTFGLADSKERYSFPLWGFMITRGPRFMAIPGVFIWP